MNKLEALVDGVVQKSSSTDEAVDLFVKDIMPLLEQDVGWVTCYYAAGVIGEKFNLSYEEESSLYEQLLAVSGS